MKFCLVRGKPALKCYSYDWLHCKKQRAKPNPWPLFQESRITPFLPPFMHTIIDLFGPTYVKKQTSKRKKLDVLSAVPVCEQFISKLQMHLKRTPSWTVYFVFWTDVSSQEALPVIEVRDKFCRSCERAKRRLGKSISGRECTEAVC